MGLINRLQSDGCKYNIEDYVNECNPGEYAGMDTKDQISIIIPFYNERDNLAILCDDLKRSITKYHLNTEIIFVDDGSTDGSGMIIQKIGDQDQSLPLTLITLRRNCGKSVALNTGIELSKGSILVTMDGDNQDNPECLIDLIRKIEEGYDVVSGWKKDRKDPFSKIFPSAIFNYIIRFMSGLTVKDVNSGFKAYKRWVWEDLILQGDHYRFILLIAYEKGAKVIEVPVIHRERLHGHSKYSIGRILHGLIDIMFYYFFLKFRSRPSHFFIRIGLLLFIPGCLVLLWFLGNHMIYLLTGDVTFGMQLRPLILFAIMLNLAALQLFCIGIVAEYLLLITKYKENYTSKIERFFEKNA